MADNVATTTRVRRPLLRALVCAAFGVMTSVVVAWLVVVVNPIPPEDGKCVGNRDRNPTNGEGNGHIELWERHSLGTTQHWAWVLALHPLPPDYTGPNPRPREESDYHFDLSPSSWVRSHVLPWETGAAQWPPDQYRDLRFVEMRGWPIRCLWCEFDYSGSSPCVDPVPLQPFVGTPVIRGGLPGGFCRLGPNPVAKKFPIAFPLRPYWPGLILDSFVWALAWLLLLTGLPALKRRVTAALRHHRNLCPTCAYDLQATPPNSPCPECGHMR